MPDWPITRRVYSRGNRTLPAWLLVTGVIGVGLLVAGGLALAFARP